MAALDGMPLSAGSVAAMVNGRLIGNPAVHVAGISIDSRTLTPGSLFVAIRGERFDGHAFVPAALARGACGVVVSQAPAGAAAGPEGTPVVIVVDDTVRALQALARRIRLGSGARVVAITGSIGKTTTKEIAAEFLATRYRVFRNRGNLNNHIGLPLSLIELRHRPEVAVVELGMNHAGEIRTLVAVAEPEVRVWTNVAEVHAAYFSSIDAIADAKAEIFEGATRSSVLVANAGDPLVMARAPRFAGRVVTFGIGTPADVRASAVVDLGLEGKAADVHTPAGAARLRTPLIGQGNLANVLAAVTIALQFDVPLDVIVARAATLEPVPHRGQVVRLRDGITLIDDSYNSSPTALQGMLDVIGRAARGGRRVAVLGEMLELGPRAVPLHEACGRAAAAAGLDVLVTVGGAAGRALGAAAVAAGVPEAAVTHVATSDEAADLVVTLVRPSDLVLVKGSHGVGTDVVVERLKVELA